MQLPPYGPVGELVVVHVDVEGPGVLPQVKTRYDDETWTQYRVRYEGEVRALLDALERREWCDVEKRKEIEGELDAFCRSPSQRIERVAARLDAFAKRL